MRVVVRMAVPFLVLASVAAFGGTKAPAPLEPQAPEDLVSLDSEAEDDVPDEDNDPTDGAESLAASDGDATLLAGEPGERKKHARAPRGGCANDMARVGETTCMDKFEAPNRRGAKPLVMQSANDAETWCEARHKRLCTEDEWVSACEGAEKRQYPYGADHEEGRCNDDKVWRQVNEPVLGKWPAAEAKEHTKELYQAATSGSKRGCKSDRGVFDLTGNVEEWVTRSQSHANSYRHLLIGCYWSGCYGGGKPTCRSTNNAHGPEFRFYETGFRCCKDPREARHREEQ